MTKQEALASCESLATYISVVGGLERSIQLDFIEGYIKESEDTKDLSLELAEAIKSNVEKDIEIARIKKNIN